MLTVSTFLSDKVEEALGSKNYVQLLEDVCKPEHIRHIQNEGMDLITKLCENGLACSEDLESTATCSKCLLHVVHNYKPKESLICLLEQGERFVNSDKFTCLLPSLQFVMLNLPKKREKTFSWVLSTLKSHIKYHCVVPAELMASMMNIQKKNEAILFESDPRIRSILQTYQEYIDFYTPFVEELEVGMAAALESNEVETMNSIRRQQDYLRDYLVDLLGVPLIHFDLDWIEGQDGQVEEPIPQPGPNSSSSAVAVPGPNNPKIKTDARIIAEKLMKLLFKVDRSPLAFFRWIDKRMNVVQQQQSKPPKKKESESGSNDVQSKGDFDKDDSDASDEDEEEIVVHMSSIVTYLYLVFDQHLPVQKRTSVYSPTYMFNMILYPVSTVLKNLDNILALKKAIGLATRLISLCDTTPRVGGNFSSAHRFDAHVLKTNIHCIFIERIFYLAIYCRDESIRHESYILYKQYLMAFQPQGKYDLIEHIVRTIPCDSLIGHMTMELKQFIHIATDGTNPNFEEGMDTCFLGISGTRLVSMICKLKNGVTTDLCQHNNQIIASLNLLRYLLLREKNGHVLGILDLFPTIEESLLQPLRKGLELSRAHYELKLKDLRDPHLQKDRENEEKRMFEDLKCDVQIGDEKIKPGDISMKEQKDAVVNSLNTFDQMSGLLAWVYEAHTACKNKL